MKRVLAIIDLQKEYLNYLTAGGQGRVRDSMMAYVYTLLQTQKYDLIINVSYFDELGRTTDTKLKRLLKGIPNVVDVSKDENDGSQQILVALYLKGVRIKDCKLEMVGVFGNLCVYATIDGLCQSGTGIAKNIYLHKNGVASDCQSAQRSALKRAKENFNVNVI